MLDESEDVTQELPEVSEAPEAPVEKDGADVVDAGKSEEEGDAPGFVQKRGFTFNIEGAAPAGVNPEGDSGSAADSDAADSDAAADSAAADSDADAAADSDAAEKKPAANKKSAAKK